MKTTLKYFTLMATLALFSTITQQASAQKSSTASMTVKATVVEAASVETLGSLVFANAQTNDSGFTSISMQPAGFSVSGIANAEIGITITEQHRESEDMQSVFFAPSVKVDGISTGFGSQLNGNVIVQGLGSQLRGKTSVWIEGVLQSEEEMVNTKFQSEYLVSVEYN